MPIVDPVNSASQSHDSLAQLTSAVGLLAAAGDPLTTSGGPEATIAPQLTQGYSRGSGTAGLIDRVPDTFKTVSASASGDTAVWTPASGKKFRLLRVLVTVTSNASQSSGGVMAIALGDDTTPINLTFDVYVPTTEVTTGGAPLFSSGWIDLGPTGILSALADNPLNVSLAAALATGACRVIVAGTEE